MPVSDQVGNRKMNDNQITAKECTLATTEPWLKEWTTSDGLTDSQIIWMSYPRKDEIASMKRTVVMARDLNVTDSWVRALKISIKLNQIRMWMPTPIRRLSLRFRRLVGLGTR